MMDVKDVNTAKMKEEIRKLNENGILEASYIKKIRTVGIKKIDMMNLFIEAITTIGENGEEDELEDSTIEFYNSLVESPEDTEDEEDEKEDEYVDEDEEEAEELENLSKEELVKTAKDFDIKTTGLSKEELINAIEEVQSDSVMEDEEDVNEDNDEEFEDEEDAEDNADDDEDDDADVDEKEKKTTKKTDESAKSPFGHLLSKQTGKMDKMLVEGASYTEIIKEVGNRRKDITRHLRRLYKKGYTILKKEAADPMGTVYRVTTK